MTPADYREYQKSYMARYRIEGAKNPRVRKPIRLKRHRPPRVFKALPLKEQREGHCCICGLLALDGQLCGFCKQEIAA